MSSRGILAVGCVTVFFGYFCGLGTVLLFGRGEPSAALAYASADLLPDWGQAFCAGPLFVLAVLLCGVSMIGWLFVFPCVLLKTYGLGYAAGLFLRAFGVRGWLPIVLCFLPSAAAECVLLVRAARLALPQSSLLMRAQRRRESLPPWTLTRYFFRSVVLFQASSFVMIWDLLLSPRIHGAIRELL